MHGGVKVTAYDVPRSLGLLASCRHRLEHAAGVGGALEVLVAAVAPHVARCAVAASATELGSFVRVAAGLDVPEEERHRVRRAAELHTRGERGELREGLLLGAGSGRLVLAVSGLLDGGPRGLLEELAASVAARIELEAARHAEREARASLRAVLDTSTAVIHFKDRHGRYVLVNGEHERRFGSRAADLVGKSLWDVYPAAIAERLFAHDREVLATGAPLQVEEEVPQADGLHTFLSVKSPIFDEKGEVRGICGVSTDITQRRSAEEALRKLEERFAKVFHASPVGITLSRRLDGRFIDVNESCERMSGYSRQELVGRSAVELGLWVSIDERADVFGRLERGERVQAVSSRLRTRTGSLRTCELWLELVEIAGEPCILTIAHDVTDQKRLEEQVHQSQKMEAIGCLAGGVAHDFNNILTSILGNCGLLLREAPEGHPQAALLRQIQRSATRAAGLTRQLLIFGRHKQMLLEQLDLNELVEALLGILARLVGEDVALEARLDPAIGRVRADRALVEQVLFNLLGNARDAMPDGGHVVIETAAAPDQGQGAGVRLSVLDDGVGMSEETRLRVFEPFFTTKAPGKGTGLGLSSVFSIVEQSGGRISVGSELGHGTRFDILLPAVTESDAPEGPLERESAGPAPQAALQTVLLVEDDEDVREFTQIALAQAGFRVLVAPDGLAALRLAEAEAGPIDAVVSDLVMPRLKGPELAARLRVLRPHIRVLHISGYPADALARSAERPVDALLEKPFTADQLVARLRRLLADPG